MAKKAQKKAAPARYTKPALRERLKKRITAGDKGGAAGQWSARKAQMLAAAYKKEGGGYDKPKAATQKHLDQWTDEKWTTADGSKARTGKKTQRYLPKEAWDSLSDAEKKRTEVKKERGSKNGEQFVANAPKAKAARKAASKKTAANKSSTRKTKKKTAAKKTTKKRAHKKSVAKKPATAKKKTARATSAKKTTRKKTTKRAT